MLARSFAAGLGLVALCAAGLASAQAIEAENLLVGMPEGFEVGYEQAQDGAEIHEFIPAGESVEDWSQMATIQIYHGLGDLPGDRFASEMSTGWKDACVGSTVTKLTEGDVNGFPFVLWSFVCPLNPQTGKPETMYFKGIVGSDAFYSVQYAYRDAQNDDLETVALTYLAGASACDTRKPERACPEGM